MKLSPAVLELIQAERALTFFSYCFSSINSMREIQDLNLRGCSWIVKEDLLRILGGLRRICYLDISFIPAVDDEVAFFLGENHWTSLIMLQLRLCASLTDKGLNDLCEGLSRMREKRSR